MVAIRTLRVLKGVGIIGASFLALVALLALLAPVQHRSLWAAYVHWLWALPLGLVIWFVLEAIGTKALSHPAIEGLSSPVRVLIVVLVSSLCVVLALAVIHIWGANAP
jgi:hypothetical protein